MDKYKMANDIAHAIRECSEIQQVLGTLRECVLLPNHAGNVIPEVSDQLVYLVCDLLSEMEDYNYQLGGNAWQFVTLNVDMK